MTTEIDPSYWEPPDDPEAEDLFFGAFAEVVREATGLDTSVCEFCEGVLGVGDATGSAAAARRLLHRHRRDHMTERPHLQRTRHLAFVCPICGHENAEPRLSKTEGGTDIVVCGGCSQQVSASLVASTRDRQERARAAAINDFLGWGTDVY